MKHVLALLTFSCLCGCVKDSDYSFTSTYDHEISDVKVTLTSGSLPANGMSMDTVTISILSNDLNDSISITGLNLAITTTAGTFVGSTMPTLSLVPAYTYDSVSKQRVLMARAYLVSPTSLDTAAIKVTYLQAEKDTTVTFYRVYPTKLKLTPSTLWIAPFFDVEDTIYAKISGGPGSPTAGDSIMISAWDTTYKIRLGTFRVANTKSDATGQCYFVYVLGDSVINGVNYYGTVNLTGMAANGTPKEVLDTVTIYSR
jgi:hypothetical protein